MTYVWFWSNFRSLLESKTQQPTTPINMWHESSLFVSHLSHINIISFWVFWTHHDLVALEFLKNYVTNITHMKFVLKLCHIHTNITSNTRKSFSSHCHTHHTWGKWQVSKKSVKKSVTSQSQSGHKSVKNQPQVGHKSVKSQSLVHYQVSHKSIISQSLVSHKSITSQSQVSHKSIIRSVTNPSSVGHKTIISQSQIHHQVSHKFIISQSQNYH